MLIGRMLALGLTPRLLQGLRYLLPGGLWLGSATFRSNMNPALPLRSGSRYWQEAPCSLAGPCFPSPRAEALTLPF